MEKDRKPDPQLSILIVNYNSLHHLLVCLQSLRDAVAPVALECIVVDNSGEVPPDALGNVHDRDVRLIRSSENLGFARAVNRAAVDARGRRLLMLNPDTMLDTNALSALWAFAEEEPDRRIWGGRTLFADGQLNPGSCWRHVSLWSLGCSALGLSSLLPTSALFNAEGYGGWRRDTRRDVDIVVGCFLLIDADQWHGLGGFDERFFMYGEDADLCFRAARSGARPGITPEAMLVHHGGGSTRSVEDEMVGVTRARITFIRKHWHPRTAALGRSLIVAAIAARHFVAPITRVLARPRRKAPKWHEVWRRQSEWLL